MVPVMNFIYSTMEFLSVTGSIRLAQIQIRKKLVGKHYIITVCSSNWHSCVTITVIHWSVHLQKMMYFWCLSLAKTQILGCEKMAFCFLTFRICGLELVISAFSLMTCFLVLIIYGHSSFFSQIPYKWEDVQNCLFFSIWLSWIFGLSDKTEN